MTIKSTFSVSLLALLITISPFALAQDNTTEGTTEVVTQVVEVVTNKGPDDALNRGTPRGSIVGFLDACSKFDIDIASEYLDLRNLPRDVEALGGAELARKLNHVLSRSVWLDDYSVSNNPEGIKGDGLPGYRDRLVQIKTNDGDVELWMQRVPRGDGESIWKLSNRSVALIPQLYEEFSYPEGVETIRGWFPPASSFLGLEMFKWFIVLAIGFAIWPVFYLFGRLFTRLITSPAKENYVVVRQVFSGPLVAIGVLVVCSIVLQRLGVGAKAQQIMEAGTLIILVFVWASWSILNLNKEHQQRKMEKRGRPGAAKLMRPMTTLLKMVILVLAVLFWLSNLGVNVSTVLAGLGVGGLALALALQKPIEDMMGALTIFSQASIKVGDFCRYGDITGVVEDIGLRTTRLRTLTNTLVSIPNSRIAHVEVENISARSKIRYWPTLRLRYDTTADQIQEITDGIRQLLCDHECVHDEPVRVRFTDFADDAILIKLHSFLKTTDFTEALEIGEGINLQVMAIVQAAGARFALPGRSIVMEGQSAS